MGGILKDMEMTGGVRDAVRNHADKINPVGCSEIGHQVSCQCHDDSLVRYRVAEFDRRSLSGETQKSQINPALNTGSFARLEESRRCSGEPILPFLHRRETVFRHVKVDSHAERR